MAHHFQQGVPFTASDTRDFGTDDPDTQNEIDHRIASTATDKQIYLAVDSLNAARNDLTDLWESHPNMSRPSPWDTRGFADTAAITAYTDFSIALIERLRTQFGKLPVHSDYGTEIRDLMINNSTAYQDFYTHFAPAVYLALKATYPELDLMVSIALKSPGGPEMDTVKTGFTHIADYADVVGISTYGYAFYGHDDAGDPNSLPTDWLTQIEDIAPGKSY